MIPMPQPPKIQHGGSRENSGRQSRAIDGDMIINTTWRYTKGALKSLANIMSLMKDSGFHAPNKSLVVNYAVNAMPAFQLVRLASIYDKAILKHPDSTDNTVKVSKVYYTEDMYTRVSRINSVKNINMGIIVSSALIHLEVEIESAITESAPENAPQFTEIEESYQAILQLRNAD